MNALVKKAYLGGSATIDKIRQVIMLYDGAITALMRVKQAISEKNIEVRYNNIEKAVKILSGLKDAVDFSQGEDIAKTLVDWYDGTIFRIISINSSESFEMCDLCIKHLKQMRDSWNEADEISKAESPQEEEENFKFPIANKPQYSNFSGLFVEA